MAWGMENACGGSAEQAFRATAAYRAVRVSNTELWSLNEAQSSKRQKNGIQREFIAPQAI
jgi:hypothetical protein